MSDISRNDLYVIEGEARISDERLQAALGISKLHGFRQLFRAHKDELETYAPILTQSVSKIGKKGRPKTTYLFTEEQTLLIAMFSRTARAAEARRQLISVFQAWRRGDLHNLQAARHGVRGSNVRLELQDAFEASAERADTTLRHLKSLSDMDAFAREVSHLPIWSNGRRPPWWSDLDVRQFLTASHRQMSLLQAEAEGQRLFGDRCPKKSAIGLYWLRLDAAKQLVAAKDACAAGSSAA